MRFRYKSCTYIVNFVEEFVMKSKNVLISWFIHIIVFLFLSIVFVLPSGKICTYAHFKKSKYKYVEHKKIVKIEDKPRRKSPCCFGTIRRSDLEYDDHLQSGHIGYQPLLDVKLPPARSYQRFGVERFTSVSKSLPQIKSR